MPVAVVGALDSVCSRAEVVGEGPSLTLVQSSVLSRALVSRLARICPLPGFGLITDGELPHEGHWQSEALSSGLCRPSSHCLPGGRDSPAQAAVLGVQWQGAGSDSWLDYFLTV